MRVVGCGLLRAAAGCGLRVVGCCRSLAGRLLLLVSAFLASRVLLELVARPGTLTRACCLLLACVPGVYTHPIDHRPSYQDTPSVHTILLLGVPTPRAQWEQRTCEHTHSHPPPPPPTHRPRARQQHGGEYPIPVGPPTPCPGSPFLMTVHTPIHPPHCLHPRHPCTHALLPRGAATLRHRDWQPAVGLGAWGGPEGVF